MNVNELSKCQINEICELAKELKHKLLRVALTTIQSTRPDYPKTLDKISREFAVSRPKLYEYLAVFIGLLRLFLGLSDKEFNAKLADIGFTNDFINDLPLVGNRQEVYETAQQFQVLERRQITTIKWRIDISLCNSSLMQKVQNSIVMSVKLKDDKNITVNMDRRTFHLFRFNVACLMKELQTIKQKHNFKIN